MHKFDYSFLKYGFISGKVVNMATSIYSLKTMANVRKADHIKIFTELEKIAKIQSVKNSNAIDGIVTSDERIKAIVTQSSAPLNHDEAEIAGYRDALNEIHANNQYIEFNEKDVLRLHEILLSSAGYEYGGKYKNSDNAIIEVDVNGNRKIRFAPTPASENKGSNGATCVGIYGRDERCGNKSIIAHSVCYSRFFVYSPVPRRQRKNVKIAFVVVAVQKRF